MNAVESTNPVLEMYGGHVSEYSRARAIEDGFIIDVTEQAKKNKFNVPVALTQQAFHDCIYVLKVDEKKLTTSEDKRLTRLLQVLRFTLRSCSKSKKSSVNFKFTYQTVRNGSVVTETTDLGAFILTGDDGEPAITIDVTHSE